MKGVVFYMSKVVKNIWLACGFLVIVALSEVVCYKAAVNKFENGTEVRNKYYRQDKNIYR